MHRAPGPCSSTSRAASSTSSRPGRGWWSCVSVRLCVFLCVFYMIVWMWKGRQSSHSLPHVSSRRGNPFGAFMDTGIAAARACRDTKARSKHQKENDPKTGHARLALFELYESAIGDFHALQRTTHRHGQSDGAPPAAIHFLQEISRVAVCSWIFSVLLCAFSRYFLK